MATPTKNTIQYADPTRLQLHPVYANSPRLNEPVDDLVESYRNFGYKPFPIVVVREGKQGLVVAGSRRFRAALEFQKEQPDFQVGFILDDSGSESATHFIENAHRRDNSPLTEAFEIVTAVSTGMSYEEIGKAKGISHQTARNYAALATMPKSVRSAVENWHQGKAGGISPTGAFAFNTGKFKIKAADGSEQWNAKLIEETLTELKQTASLSGGKLKVSSAKAAASGKSSERPTNNVLRLIAKSEACPTVYSLLLQFVTGDMTMIEAKNRAGGELDWLVLPTKAKKEKAAKPQDAKPAKKTKAKVTAIADEGDEPVPTQGVVLTDADLESLFN